MAIAQQRLKSLSIQFKIKQLHIKNIAWNSFILLFCYVRFKNCRISSTQNSYHFQTQENKGENERISRCAFDAPLFFTRAYNEGSYLWFNLDTEYMRDVKTLIVIFSSFQHYIHELSILHRCYQDSYLLHSNNTCRFKKSHKQTQIMKFFVFLKSMKSTTQNSFVSSLFCTFPGKRFHFSSWNSYQFGNIQNYSLVLCLYL